MPRLSVEVGVDPPSSRKQSESVFEQVRTKLGSRSKNTLRVTHSEGVESRYWKVDLVGLGAAAWSDTQDEGGLFRACTRDICVELQSSTLPLLVPAPNAALGVRGRDRWVPAPSLPGATLSQLEREQYQFLGALMGTAARGGAFMELDLAPVVWRKLLGEAISVADLSAIDERIAQFLTHLGGVEDEAEWDAAGVRWRVRNAAGNIVRLKPVAEVREHCCACCVVSRTRSGGLTFVIDALQDERVPFAAKDAYVAACLKLRLGEFDLAIEEMKRGLSEVVPLNAGLGLMGWREIEKRVCGEPRIDIEL